MKVVSAEVITKVTNSEKVKNAKKVFVIFLVPCDLSNNSKIVTSLRSIISIKLSNSCLRFVDSSILKSIFDELAVPTKFSFNEKSIFSNSF